MSTNTVDLYDPDLYVDGPIHEIFAELRRTDPVHWQEMPGEPGYWLVLKHADLSWVARHPEPYSAETMGVVLEDPEPEQLALSRNMLLMMDPPRHGQYRKPLVNSFKAKVIAAMGDRIREICTEILDGVADQRNVEFVHDISAKLPNQVVGELVGIPKKDWPQINIWAEQSTSSQDPDLGTGYAPSGLSDMAIYAMEFAAQRRNEPPREDLTTLILSGSFGGAPMTDMEFGSFFVQLVTAGNDTTKTMLSSGLHALLDHPDQLQSLRDDPSRLPTAVEEILRYANPLHYFRRTATKDTELRGVQIKAGEKVAMCYTSANRDEEVFDRPQEFDVTRHPNPHLSFGLGHHFCLGAHLARLEGRIFFEELLRRFPKIEMTGNAVRIRSNLNNGLKKLPLQLTPA